LVGAWYVRLVLMLAAVQAIVIKVATVIARTKLVATNTPKTSTTSLSGANQQSTLTIGAGQSPHGTNSLGAGYITVSGAGGGGGGATGITMASGTLPSWANSTSAKVSMQGQLTLEGENPDIMIGGKSMAKWMQKVEQRLSILEPKPQLLAKYEALQQAFDHYKTLEALLHGTEDDKD
jgi:hypothetical protein